MILRIIFLACAIVSPSFGKMDLRRFTAKFEDMCFQNEESDPFRVNGQDTPLSNTIENFIAMAEKFEMANPTFDLKEELVYFISEYLFENIRFINRKVSLWQITRLNMETIDSMWDPERTGYKPTPVNPFTDAEKCSIYYMLSHSMLKKDPKLDVSYSSRNFNMSSNSNRAYTELRPDDFYPQELGVVSIRGTDAAVSLSKVLTGLYVGLLPNRKTDLAGYETVQNLQIPDDRWPTDKTVDAVYAVTLAEVLMLANWIGSDRRGLAPNGKWVSIPLSDDKTITGFCPMVYTQQQEQAPFPAYSYSSVRGAADGLILGSAIAPIYQKKSSTRLSQILRMYYSPDGINLDTQLEETTEKKITFCNRQDLITTLESKLGDQMLSYGYLIAESAKDVDTALNDAKNMYGKVKGQIYENSNTEIQQYCSRIYSMEKPEDLPRETFLDVIVVMDSSNQESSFQEQQLIVGYLAKHLDLRNTGSRMTILLDQKINYDSGTSSKIELKSVVYDTYSSACAACTVGQIAYEPSTVEREDIIIAVSQFLQERKENETNLSGTNGKVVIYFNYQNDNGGRNGNNKIQGNLEKALRNLHLNHQDVLFYAVGLDSELLKKYAKNDPSLVFLGTDGAPEDVAKKIFRKISFSPALLQYSDCEEAKNEKAAVYENFVSPHTLQHYVMPAEYFYKSRGLSVFFESQNGYIRVCHNRATMRPENEAKFCKNTTGNAAIEFKLSNPCKSFTKETCAPFYFSIMGMDSILDMRQQDTRPRDYCNDINDHWCENLNQVKYKVSHTGIRCSGCLGLGATQAVVLFTALLTYFVYKRF